MIEHHLQAAARTIRDSRPADLAVERMRSEIYKHVYEAIEICARYAFADRNTSPSASTPSPTLNSLLRRGEGGGVGDLAADLDFLKEE